MKHTVLHKKVRDKDAQLMMEALKEAQWGSDDPAVGALPDPDNVPDATADPDYKGPHPDLAKITGYHLNLTTQQLTSLDGKAVMSMIANMKPVDGPGGVTYAYQDSIIIIPNQQPADRLATAT